jgi:hypothetical protein
VYIQITTPVLVFNYGFSTSVVGKLYKYTFVKNYCLSIRKLVINLSDFILLYFYSYDFCYDFCYDLKFRWLLVIASVPRMEDAYKLRLNYICFIYIKIGTTVCVYNNELYYCTVLVAF